MNKRAISLIVLIFVLIFSVFIFTACNNEDKISIDFNSLNMQGEYNASTNKTEGTFSGIINNDSNTTVTGIKIEVKFYTSAKVLIKTLDLKTEDLNIESGSDGAFSIPYSFLGNAAEYEFYNYEFYYVDSTTEWIIWVVAMVILFTVLILISIISGRIKKTYEWCGHTIELKVLAKKSLLILDGEVIDNDNSIIVVNLRLEGTRGDIHVVAKVGVGFFRPRTTVKVNDTVLTPVKKRKKDTPVQSI